MPPKRMVKISKKNGISNDQKITFSKCDLHTQTNSAYNTSREMLYFFSLKLRRLSMIYSVVLWDGAGHQGIDPVNSTGKCQHGGTV